ncbi:MAG: hypothetical protein ACRDND_33535, partial [Streptosporangiaceae bacterium]
GGGGGSELVQCALVVGADAGGLIGRGGLSVVGARDGGNLGLVSPDTVSGHGRGVRRQAGWA